jgi:predicted nuclease of predicted toxin-antitoxin system
MRILIDMNLSPDWKNFLENNGHISFHWTEIGKVDDPDIVLFEWAAKNEFTIFTHDLDFGAILAFNNALKPSVVQARTQDISIEIFGNNFLTLLSQFKVELEDGAIVTFYEEKMKVRILPFKK